MPERLTDSLLNNSGRQALIKVLPCFAGLSAAESQELANLMYELHVLPGEVIVAEDALIDKVFIIISGQAEVTHGYTKISRIIKKKITTQVPIATLHEGETIGLNDTGFFSSSGKRTATVTALTEMHLLALDLKDLHQFFHLHPDASKAMSTATEQMLKMKLIKESLPFNRLSIERLNWLANKVETISFAAGNEIFQQGEMGKECYLIISGQIEIYNKNEDGSERHIALLKPTTLFGEATLITRSPRNASARAIVNSDLLVLHHDHLSELIESEENVADTFMTLMVDRSRPAQNPNIIAHERKAADGQPIVILKNPDNGSYFKLSKEGWFIWELLDGKKTMQNITIALSDQFNIFAPDIVAALISKLAKAGFIINVEVSQSAEVHQALWVRWMLKIKRLLEIRFVLGDADKWLSRFYQSSAYLLFTRLGKVLLALFAISGFMAFIYYMLNQNLIFKNTHADWILLCLLIPFTLLTVGLHELGHALATKFYGNEVHYMGIGWYWFGPVAFTDTSDMWMSARGPRVFVNLAGIYADTLVAAAASLLIFIVHNHYIQGFLLIFALLTYINAFRMLSPLQELDGYYILMDILDRPHLRQSAVIWLVKEFPKSLRHPSLMKQHFPEIIYWLVCIIFLVLVTLLTLFVQKFILGLLGIHTHHPMISLILPFFVVILTSIGILADIRSQK